jgi:hypothetical protein
MHINPSDLSLDNKEEEEGDDKEEEEEDMLQWKRTEFPQVM